MDYGEYSLYSTIWNNADYYQPTLWLMYWLNYLDRNAIALARLNDLEEDLNLTGEKDKRDDIVILKWNCRLTVPNLRLDLICRLSPRPNTFQHASHRYCLTDQRTLTWNEGS